MCPCPWIWFSTRNLLCRQWSHKKGNRPGKRVHCEATGFREGTVGRNGSNTCCRFHGKIPPYPSFRFSILICMISLPLSLSHSLAVSDTEINLIFKRRFCSNVGMNNQAVKAAQESVQKSEEFDIRYYSLFSSSSHKLPFFQKNSCIHYPTRGDICRINNDDLIIILRRIIQCRLFFIGSIKEKKTVS